MPERRYLTLLVLLLVALWSCPAAAEAERPRRIVSLNLCADELLLRLADRETLLSVTWLALEPGSASRELVGGIPVNHGLAEEVVPLAPDLVVAGLYTTRTAVAFLKRLDIPVLELDVPQSLDGVLAQIERVAAAIGHSERGEAMVAEMTRALADLGPPPPGPWPRAVVYRPNGFTVGRGSLVDDLLQRAGLVNLAAELDLESYGQLPLEILLLERPEVLIVNAAEEAPPSLAQELLAHRALLSAEAAWRTVVVPPALWTCEGPGVVEAIRLLRDAAP